MAHSASRRVTLPVEDASPKPAAEPLVGTSDAIRSVQAQVELAARSEANVVVAGESGVGKQLVARVIHQRSRRSQTPLAAIDCAGMPDALLEWTLFGDAGAPDSRGCQGILELSAGATVFIREISDMSLRMQAQLLRFLDDPKWQHVPAGSESCVGVRVIATSKRRILDLVTAKSFRQDLYCRVNVIDVMIAPLRERREDIPVLLNHFAAASAEQNGSRPPEFTPDALESLVAYEWPGNVRELKKFAGQLVARNLTGLVTLDDLPDALRQSGPSSRVTLESAGAVSVPPDQLFDRIVNGGDSFWTAVHDRFISRDLTRADVRAVLRKGLEQVNGNYRALVELFNMQPGDYKPFLNFLRKHACQLPFQPFRERRSMPSGRSVPQHASPSARSQMT